MELVRQKIKRGVALTKRRGVGWLIRELLAELPLLPSILIFLANLVSGSRLSRCLISLSGVHTDQAWAERSGKLREITQSFVKSQPVDLLEIGTWFGEGSTSAFFDVLPDGSNITLVDPWRPYSTATDRAQAPTASARKMDRVPHIAINSTLERIYKLEKTRNLKATLIRSPSEHCLPMLKDKSFDVIYIDGSHYYAAVKRDIRQAKRLIKNEGLICGDDLDLAPTEVLHELARRHLDQDLVLLDKGNAIHPGVLAAVAEEFEQVNAFEGFWWIYVKDGQFHLTDPRGAKAHTPSRAMQPVAA